MRPKSLILLLLALGCGLVAAIGVAQVMSNKDSAPSTRAPAGQTEIVVASTEVPPGAVLTEEMVCLVGWPEDSVPVGAMTSIEDALDRQAANFVAMGTPV